MAHQQARRGVRDAKEGATAALTLRRVRVAFGIGKGRELMAGLIGKLGLAIAFLATGLIQQAAAQDIVIGGLFAATGPAAVIGVPQQRGLDYAVTLANEKGGIRGRKIKVLYEDTQARPDRTILAFNKLTDLNEAQVLMTSYSGATLAIAPLATRKQVVLVNATAQADNLRDASPYLFNMIPLLKEETDVLGKFVAGNLKKKTAVIVYENGPAGLSGRDDLKASFGAAGGQIIGEEAVQLGETNFRPTLLKVAAQSPDVVFVVLTFNVKLFAEQVKQQRLAATVIGTTYLTDPDLVNSGFTEGWYSSAIPIAAPASMDDDFKKRYDADFGIFSRQYFNAANIVFAAIDAVLADNEKLTGEAVRKKMLSVQRFTSLATLDFKTNNAAMQISVVKYEQKAVKPVQ
jgi:branched-chain amino acid transport system substrate-binding protein